MHFGFEPCPLLKINYMSQVLAIYCSVLKSWARSQQWEAWWTPYCLSTNDNRVQSRTAIGAGLLLPVDFWAASGFSLLWSPSWFSTLYAQKLHIMYRNTQWIKKEGPLSIFYHYALLVYNHSIPCCLCYNALKKIYNTCSAYKVGYVAKSHAAAYT